MIASQDTKLQELKDFIADCKNRDYPESQLIAILHKAQGLYGYLSKEIMDEVAQGMSIPTAHIWGVATFYHYFNLEPIGKYVISICLGTACYVKGANDVLEAIKKELNIDIDQTTEDKLFTLQVARCLGACGLAPVIMINGKIHGELNPEKVVSILKEYRKKG
ncbi:MAG: NADH-quinone oxidoreductase subunit NuoE [Candidatus Omnitrophota bacterium]|jgi:NADH:ubiquinone oxidoreductase subunit E|nr:MAG: NADH-quinone oxidoreductase subunit NuoE [Candidatus Omnitrophota bacterium]